MSYSALIALAAIALVAVAMKKASTKISKFREALASRVFAHDRFVDCSVRLCTVVADAIHGAELLPGKPKLRIIRERILGGVVDTKANPPRIDASQPTNPVTWYCSTDAEPIILHGDDVALAQLVYGAESAGKTVLLIQWLWVRVLENLGHRREIGVTAPTEKRVEIVLAELRKFWPARWFTFRAGDGVATVVDGTIVRFVSTYQQSAAQGSRVQGYSWCASASDELQDSLNAADDIDSRGRAAPGGRYKRLATATAKDSPDWRDFRDKLDTARGAQGEPLWIRRTLFGERSPFVDPSHWIRTRSQMSAREARRRLDAQDVAPERATYPSWDRSKNLIPIPDIGWSDVTARELAPYMDNATVLVGHDPGSLCDVSIFLKAYCRNFGNYQRGTEHPMWFVVGEMTTDGTTHEAHVKKVLELAAERWHCNMRDRRNQLVEGGPRIFVRADPAGDTDNKTHESVYTIWKQHGVTIRPAAWSKTNPTNHGRIPKDAGIEVVNTLLCNSLGQRRLFVARNDDGTPCAPRLVAAIETSERDLEGKAETQKKLGLKDPSHWVASLRYPLWILERPRLADARNAV